MKFGVLGPLHARIRAQQVPLNGARQAKMLAALLVEANHVVSIHRLVDVMWDDEGPATAVRQVQDAVSGLRRNLTGCGAPPTLISTQRGGYRLQLDASQLDLLDFERERQLAQQCQEPADTAAGLRRALECWRGPALADLSSRVLESDALRLNALRTTVHKQCLDLELTLGRHREVADEATALLQKHPHDEQVAAQAMLALYRSGRRGQALEVYQHTRCALADDIGVDPAPPLQDLHRRILGADPSLAAPVGGSKAVPVHRQAVPRQLSADLADFTGRQEMVARLQDLLTGISEPGGPVVLSALDGAGGVGKTSLAVHVAHRVLAQFPDGQLQIDLHGGGGTPADPGEVLARFLRGLGVPSGDIPADPEERGALYRSTVAGRRVLVLLDNVEDAAQVRPLLPGSGTCSVLITSRSALPGLDGAKRLTLDVLDEHEALELFTRIVGGGVVAAEPESVRSVLRICAGLPLAIRLAASRLVARPGWTVRDLADRLGDERLRLGELTVEDRALRACFAVSYQDRPPDEARAFRLLGLCDGPSLSLPAAAALLALPTAATERILEALVDIHLLQSPRSGRYRLHDLLRVYAAECAHLTEPSSEQAAATHRLLSWYLHTSATASRTLNPTRRHIALDPPEPTYRPLEFADHHHALTWCETERTNLVSAVAQATRTGRHEIGWKLPITMWDLFHLRSRHEDRIDCNEMALENARALGDLEATAWVLNTLSSAYQEAGRLTEAADCLLQALDIRHRLADVRGEGSCLINLGYVHIEMGRSGEAVGILEQALGIFRRIGLRTGEAVAQTNLGEAHKNLGNLATALHHYQEALTIDREASDQFSTGRSQTNVAETLCLLGRLDEAAEQAAQGRATNQAAGNRIDEAIALDVLGQVHAAHGQLPLAVQHWEHAHAILTDLGHPRAADVGSRLNGR